MRRISWLFPAAASVAAVFALTTPAGAQQRRSCGDRFVPAVIAGKPRCLQWQTPCPADASSGPGSAYPTLSIEDGRATLRYLVGWGYDGWDGTKLLWTVPHYRGPYIVRGFSYTIVFTAQPVPSTA